MMYLTYLSNIPPGIQEDTCQNAGHVPVNAGHEPVKQLELRIDMTPRV